MPLVPVHTWLPQFSLAAPGSLTALLVGLKLGAFGLLRVAMPLAPEAAQDFHWLLAGLGTVSLLYGAVAMLAQTNLAYAQQFLLAITFNQERSDQPLPAGLFECIGYQTTTWNEMMAAALVGVLPVMVIFLFLQKYLVAGLTAGAVKE